MAEPGKTTAIIGSTGCGKSTLVNLIPRLYDATEGSITLDGENIKNISMKELRDELGYVHRREYYSQVLLSLISNSVHQRLPWI